MWRRGLRRRCIGCLRAGARRRSLFKTADQHIRCLLLAADGTLWAGSDGAGVIYRIHYVDGGGEAVCGVCGGAAGDYGAGDGCGGECLCGGCGDEGALAALPPLPVTGNVGVTITFSQPGSATAAGTNTLVPDGSEIYRIGADGAPRSC